MSLKILAIDTSTDAYSVACGNAGDIIEHFAVAPHQHSLLILDAVKKVLAESKLTLAQLDCVAFANGPGAFTGLRLAASVVQGLAMAYNLPVVMVSTLQTIAEGAAVEYGCHNVLVGLDARMNEVYWGVYSLDDGERMQAICDDMLTAPNKVIVPSQLFQTDKVFGVGDAWAVYPDVLRGCCSGVDLTVVDNYYPHARYVAVVAGKKYQKKQWVYAQDALPVYLRDKVTHGTATSVVTSRELPS